MNPTKLLFAVVALAMTIVALVGVSASASPTKRTGHSSPMQSSATVEGVLVDLAVDVGDPFDGSYADVKIKSRSFDDGRQWTKASVSVENVNADAGVTYGSHVHVGPCVEGDGDAAEGHFNITESRGEEVVVSEETEIWFEFTVDEHGDAKDFSEVDFAIPSGEGNSIVIHEMPTEADGSAGGRLACIPL